MKKLFVISLSLAMFSCSCKKEEDPKPDYDAMARKQFEGLNQTLPSGRFYISVPDSLNQK